MRKNHLDQNEKNYRSYFRPIRTPTSYHPPVLPTFYLKLFTYTNYLHTIVYKQTACGFEALKQRSKIPKSLSFMLFLLKRCMIYYHFYNIKGGRESSFCMEKKQAPGIRYFLSSIVSSIFFLLQATHTSLHLTLTPLQVNSHLLVHFYIIHLLALSSACPCSLSTNYSMFFAFILVHLYLIFFFPSLSHF